MINRLSADDYFKLIAKNQKTMLADSEFNQFSFEGIKQKTALMQEYLDHLRQFQDSEASYFDEAIKGPSLAAAVGRGVLSGLLGFGGGAALFATEQRSPSLDVFGAKTVAQGGFATALGASSAALIYTAWEKSKEKPLSMDYAAFQKEMQQSGFTHEKYATFAADLVKLFHFRECLLLNLPNHEQVHLRERFKNRYYSDKRSSLFKEANFNRAIELYFLQQLNRLFNQAFQTIYQVHQTDINHEQSPFIRWFKKHFETAHSQQQFSQQMQIDFMTTCVRYLEKEMSEPSFLGRYAFILAALAGFIAGAFVLSLLAITHATLSVLALFAINITAASIVMAISYYGITQNEQLFYQRHADNRRAIQEAIQSINKERTRLTTLIQRVVPTKPEEIEQLKQFNQTDNLSLRNLFIRTHVAFGSGQAWIREFASRYRDNKLVEIDLANDMRQLIEQSFQQTDALVSALVKSINNQPNKKIQTKLRKYLEDTETYLLDPANEAFIRSFNLVQKIKEQVLEIVGHLPLTLFNQTLPKVLIDFYTKPISTGGLGGLASDLEHARLLTPILDKTTPADEHHPYRGLLAIALRINDQLNTLPAGNLVCKGDTHYRKLLGLPNLSPPIDAQSLTLSQLNDYLNASFNFLCSLNNYNVSLSWEKPFQHSQEYIVYRMLFVKQLAVWADPNNLRVDAVIKQRIVQFTLETLHYHPTHSFSDITSQALLHGSDGDERTINDPLNNSHALTDLISLTNALRVDMVHDVNPPSVKLLICREAKQFQTTANYPILLGINSAAPELVIEASSQCVETVEQAIASTKAFLKSIQSNHLLQETQSLRVYQARVTDEVQRLIDEVDLLKQQTNNQHLKTLMQTLTSFKTSLPAQDTPSIDTTPLIDKLNKYVAYQQNKSQTVGFFHGSRHARQQKILAATTLIEALNERTKKMPNVLETSSIYQTNRRLKALLVEPTSQTILNQFSRTGFGNSSQ